MGQLGLQKTEQSSTKAELHVLSLLLALSLLLEAQFLDMILEFQVNQTLFLVLFVSLFLDRGIENKNLEFICAIVSLLLYFDVMMMLRFNNCSSGEHITDKLDKRVETNHIIELLNNFDQEE